MTLVVITFAVTLLIVLGTYWFFIVRVDQTEGAALRKRLKPEEPRKQIAKEHTLLKPAEQLSALPHMNTALGRLGGVTAPLQRDLLQAGLKVSVATILLSAGCLALLGFFVVKTVAFNTMLAIGIGTVLFFVPFMYVKHRKNKRLHLFEEQFPEAIDLIARALRAGHAFTTGLAMTAEEIPAPVGEEFKLLYDRQNFGMPLPEAMRAFAARIPLIDARFFVTAVLTQRETGGNLSEVLDNLASVIRERFKVKRQVRVLTAHGRITGWILAALPPALAAAMFVMTPGHMDTLISDPLGVQMIIGALTLQVMGTLIIRKLVNIRY